MPAWFDAMTRWFQSYILPGIIFQGVVIGGGYGTGREIVEYFVQYGASGAVRAMFILTLPIWIITLATTFEFARLFRAYDYRSLLKHLLGKFWITFEIFYILLLVIVLAVVGSAAGTLLRDYFSIPYLAGVSAMLIAIAFLVFKGSGFIERFFTVWSALIYAVYISFFAVALTKFGETIGEALKSGDANPGWLSSGFRYGLYNMVVIPAILFSTRHLHTRKEALLSGAIAAVIGLLPGFLFLVAIFGQYPVVIREEIPAVFVMEQAGVPVLLGAFIIVLFGTLVQTGTGFIHGVNERIQSAYQSQGKLFPDWMRPVVALVLLLVSLGLSTFGIISLVARGYTLISWGILIVYFLPLMTVGIYKIWQGPELTRSSEDIA